MTADVVDLKPSDESPDAETLLLQSLARARTNKRLGIRHCVVVAHVEQEIDSPLSAYEIFWSEIMPEEMLWLSKRIERAALDDGDDGD